MTFDGFRINPNASFMDISPHGIGLENEILRHREWLTYILCLSDNGPKWSYSESQSVSRAS